MTTRLPAFELPNHYVEAPCVTEGIDCDHVQLCDICDVPLCETHTDDDELRECYGQRGVFHHTDCVLGCADCYEAEADDYWSARADSIRDAEKYEWEARAV